MISQNRAIFAIERCIEIIKQANEYSTDIYSYAPSAMKFTSRFNDMDYKISVNFKDNAATSVSIFRSAHIEIKNSSKLEEVMSKLYNEAILSISRIENEKFKKIFPDYTIVEERDDKISDILDYINNKPEKENTEKETLDNKPKTKTIFQKISEWF
jgi:hypothetical protein